nr:hypothetical protein [Tanacetum cinerariifolium]
MSPRNVAWDVSVKSAVGLSPQPSRVHSRADDEPNPQPKSSHTAKEMTWHATGKCTEHGKRQHMVDGRAWKNFDKKYPNFAKEPRNVRLGLAADGFNMFNNLSQAYGMWPTILTTYNLPLWPLIDDLKVLWVLKGVETIDVATGQKFNMRAMVLWTINDFPAQSSLSRHRQSKTRLEKVGHSKWLVAWPNQKREYLPDEVAKPIIELCSFFKQICSATLMEDDMLKAQSKVFDILCNHEVVYPPACFDIVIHLVIHLPLEAFEGGPIRPQWMFPFERFIKKIKGYARNKAKLEELKKVMWYVLHNSPEIDTYQSQFKSKFPNKDMKEEFLGWFGSQIHQRHVDNDPGVSTTSELFALACRLTPTPISVNYCVVNGVRFVVHSRDERRTTQTAAFVRLVGMTKKCIIVSFEKSSSFRICRSKLYCSELSGEAFKDDQYILATQVKQCFYLEDMARRQPHWKVVEHVKHNFFSDGDVIHFDNSFDLPLSTSLNDLDNATLHIDGQSMEVDAPPNIIDLDEDNDIIDDEDALPHDSTESDEEDLVNVDDGVDMWHEATVVTVVVMIVHLHTGCEGCFANRGKGTLKPNLGGRKAGRLHTRQETRNLGLKKNTDDKGPVLIRFEWDDKKTLMPLGDHASHWSNYLGELIREMPLYYPSWNRAKSTIVCRQVSRLLARLRDQMMESSATREYPSLIHTFFVTHTVNGALGSNTPSGVPYTKEEINVLARKGTQRGHFPDVGRVNLMMKLFRSDDKFSQMLNKFESKPEFGNASGSGECWDDEMAGDEDGGEDEEDGKDVDSLRCYTWLNIDLYLANNARFVTRKPRFVDYIVFIRILDDLALLDQMR